MVTIGDAIDSFLDHESFPGDGMNEDHSLAHCGKRTVISRVNNWQIKSSISWFKAVSLRVWVASNILFITGITGAACMVGKGIHWIDRWGLDVSPKALARLGFRPHPAAIAHSLGILPEDTGSTGALIGNTIIVNSPQIMITFLYIFYNNILTRQLAADEWLRFLQQYGKRSLRSLSVVYSIVFGPGPWGTRLPHYDDSGRGFSPLAGILATSFGSALVIFLFVNSAVRKYRNVPPDFLLMGFNSSAIRTVCRGPKDNCDARFFPLRMGVVPLDEGDDDQSEPGRVRSQKPDGKIVLSTDTKIMEPVEGGIYLMPGFVPSKSIWRKFMDRMGSLKVKRGARWRKV
ncbi:uncharacterized protein BDV14DRAFT_206038 [Aspergillus stella-maris]|uniref:uncharacterized protein n=1 Tax=Aspergillus stella-maris TaxID=1810926 RepID=UPI003CCD6923